MVKIDLHTHSYASPDGGIKLEGYRKILRDRILNYVAITDHNTIDGALEVRKKLGDRIIVGEEVTSTEGEIIGLFLKKEVPSGLDAQATVREIKKQGGLVLIPHPFETVRKGISQATLTTIAKDVDMIEIRNGRALVQNRSKLSRHWSQTYAMQGVACSDAHSLRGIGRTYTTIPHKPTKQSLVSLLGSAEHATKRARLPSLLAPKVNRLKNRRRTAA